MAVIETLLLRQALIVIGCTISAYTDIKKGLIYDAVTIPMIAIGLALNVIDNQLVGIIYAAIVFGLGYLLYYTGKIGGGDVKLFAGITMLLPTFNQSIFILNVLIFSGLTGMIFISTYYSLKYYRKTKSVAKIFEENRPHLLRGVLLLAVLAGYFFILVSNEFVSMHYALALGVPMVFGAIFVSIESGVRKHFFLKKISVNEIEEDEIIAQEHLDKKIVEELKLGSKNLIGKSEAKKLAELGVKELHVYRDLPKFAPFILIGVIIAFFSNGFFSILG